MKRVPAPGTGARLHEAQGRPPGQLHGVDGAGKGGRGAAVGDVQEAERGVDGEARRLGEAGSRDLAWEGDTVCAHELRVRICRR
jgi:hypothetical protein